MTRDITVHEALSRWPIDVTHVEPIKVRENAVYLVHTAQGGRRVLRMHRAGYHSDAALLSELSWMGALAQAGIEVPRVVASSTGNPFERIALAATGESLQVDVFEWIDGRPLGTVEEGVSAEPAQIASIYTRIGEIAAQIHNQANAWLLPPNFQRHVWDADGLVGEKPVWGPFWQLEALSPSERRMLERVRWQLVKTLGGYGKGPDRFGLIHADLVPENILVDGERLRVIDFDDAGFGWHLFEIATSLYFIRREACYETARDALIAAYRRLRPLPDEHLQLLPAFLAARGTTYLGWVHTRQREPSAQALAPQLIELAMAAAADYIGARI